MEGEVEVSEVHCGRGGGEVPEVSVHCGRGGGGSRGSLW